MFVFPSLSRICVILCGVCMWCEWVALSGLDGAAPADEGEADACSGSGAGVGAEGRPSESRDAGIDTDRAVARVLASSHMTMGAVSGRRGGTKKWTATDRKGGDWQGQRVSADPTDSGRVAQGGGQGRVDSTVG